MSSMVESMQKERLTTIMAKALKICSKGMRRPKSSTCALPKIAVRIVAKARTNEVILIPVPPPTDPGDDPMNAKIRINSRVISVISERSRVQNPQLRNDIALNRDRFSVSKKDMPANCRCSESHRSGVNMRVSAGVK